MYLDYFDKFLNMEPYLYIGPDEWTYIKETFDKQDVRESLSTVAMTYPLPYSQISESEAKLDFMRLKGVRWHELLYEAPWFARTGVISNYALEYRGVPTLFGRCNIGLRSSNFFQQKNRWTVSGSQGPGPTRTWGNHQFMTSMMGALYSLKMEEVSRQTLKACLHLRKYTCAQFKPAIAKAMYEMTGAEVVLDFSMGWGDRLAGFYASECTRKYIGIDPRVENHPIYEEQAKFYANNLGWFEEEKEYEFHIAPAEDFDFTPYAGTVDLIFTSPPYFNVEKYSDDDTQSWVRYKNIDRWNTEFLQAALGKMIIALKPGGLMAINISDVYTTSGKTRAYQEITNPMNDYLLAHGMEYVGCIGMEMAKRPNSSGAGTGTKTGNTWTEHSIERLEEVADMKFAEPMWIWKRP